MAQRVWYHCDSRDMQKRLSSYDLPISSWPVICRLAISAEDYTCSSAGCKFVVSCAARATQDSITVSL